MTIEENASLLKHNTFGIEAKSALFIEYASLQELKDAITWLKNSHPELPLLHIGKGSNLLFVSDFNGCILHNVAKRIEIVSEQGDEVILRAEGGITWDDFVDYCTKAGYYGLENLSLIPGEVGAAAVQNIGAYGSEVKDFIVKVNLIDLKTAEETSLTNEQCHYAYRQSIFKNDLKGKYAVYSVDFRLSKSFTPNLDYGSIRKELEARGIAENVDSQALRQVIIEIRKGKLPEPEVLGNAGSFFMNPVVPQEKFEELLSQYPDMPHY
ncbi:MAG: UDP-N-acetylmuramate dehydrogenase, partial [Bacteroidaceae bacterium]|nr:UDP-N-acetylmuramate dehydrogenase [Bacteroidaceae bacterium]